MREIKFRVWEPLSGVMEDDQSAKFWLSQGFDKHTQKPVHFMQYTGIKDKNGVDIYEGDIVKEYASTRVRAVRKVKVYWKRNGWNINSGTYEVIGNIHENPELLEKS